MDDQEKRERSVQLFLSVHAMRRGVMNPYTQAHLVRSTQLERYATPGTAEDDARYNRNNGSQSKEMVAFADESTASVDGSATPPAEGVMSEVDNDDGTVIVSENQEAEKPISPALSAFTKPTLFSPKTGDVRTETALARRALLLGFRAPPPTASDPDHHLHHYNAALSKYVDSEAIFIETFGKLWDEGKVARMRRTLFETAEAFFDPSNPQAMVSFVALGGLDMFCRFLCLNPTWVTKEAQEAVSTARRRLTQHASAIFGPNTNKAQSASLPSRIYQRTDKANVTIDQLRAPHKSEDIAALMYDSTVQDFIGSGSDASVAGGPAIRNLGGAFGLGPVRPSLSNHNDNDASPCEPSTTTTSLSAEEDAAVDPFGAAQAFKFPVPMNLGLVSMQAAAVDNAIVLFATVVRVITEAIVCSSHMGWYLYDWRRGALIRRLLSLARIGSMREGAFILIEHMLSIVGPVIHMGSMPELASAIEDSVSGVVFSLANIRQDQEIAKEVAKLKAQYNTTMESEGAVPANETPKLRKLRIFKRRTALADLRTSINDQLETANKVIPVGLQSFLLQQELNLAAACRVISLSLVAAVMSDDRSNNTYFDDGTVNSAEPKRMEPFPQCISRIDSMDNVVSENVDFLLHVPKFVAVILRLMAKRDEKTAMRIFRGNRTMTIIADDNGNVAAPTLGGNVMPTTNGGGNNGQQTFNIGNNVQVTVTPAANNANGVPAAGAPAVTAPPQAPQPLGAFDPEELSDPDDDYDEEYDEYEDGEPQVDPVTEQLFANLNAAAGGGGGGGGANMEALQQFVNLLMQNGNGGGGGEAFDGANLNRLLQQLQDVAAGAPAAQPAPELGGNNNLPANPNQPAPAAADPQEALRQAAQGMGNEMPEANAMDSIDLDWFIGNPHSQVRWRMGAMVLRGDSNYCPSANVRSYPQGNAIVAARNAERLCSKSTGYTHSEPPSSLAARAYAKVRAAPNSLGVLKKVWNFANAFVTDIKSSRNDEKEANNDNKTGTTTNTTPKNSRKKELDTIPSAKFGVSLSHIDNPFDDMSWFYEAKDNSSIKRRQESFISLIEDFEFILRSQTNKEAVDAKEAIANGTGNINQMAQSNQVIRQYIRKQRFDHQQIVGCQSEIYFVASSLLMTQNYTLAHGAMTLHNIIPTLNRIFGHVFFTETASNTLHYAPSTVPFHASPSSASPKGGAAPDQDGDDETNLGAFRSPASTKIPTPTSANNDELPSQVDEEVGDGSQIVEVTRLVKVDNGVHFESRKTPKKPSEDASAAFVKQAALLELLAASEPELFEDEIHTNHPMTELKTFTTSKKMITSQTTALVVTVGALDSQASSGTSPTDSSVAAITSATTGDSDGEIEVEDEDEDGFVFDPEADEDNDEDDAHQHDPDTLRKLELVRVLHEFWNAQDRAEVVRLLALPPLASQSVETPTVQSSNGVAFDAIAEADTLALKISDRIVAAHEDPCIETTCLHALEAYSRVSCFEPLNGFALASDKPDRASPVTVDSQETHIRTRLLSLVKHLIEQRIWNGRHDKMKNADGTLNLADAEGQQRANATQEGQPPQGGPVNTVLATSLHPAKRSDAVMAALGEIIKFHPRNLLILNEYLKMKAGDTKHISGADYHYDLKDIRIGEGEQSGVAGPETTPTKAYKPSTETSVASSSKDLGALSSVPSSFSIGLPRPTEAGRYARRQDDTLGTLLRRRFLSYASDCNLFLRIITVSMMTGITFPSNYLRKPYDTFSLDSEYSSDAQPTGTLPTSECAASAAVKWVEPEVDYLSPTMKGSVASNPASPITPQSRRGKQTLDDYEDLLNSVIINEKRTMEPSSVLLSRMYFVRQVGRQFVDQLIAHLQLNAKAAHSVQAAEGAYPKIFDKHVALKKAKALFSGGPIATDGRAIGELSPTNWVAEYLSWLAVHSPTPFDNRCEATPVVAFGGFARETLRATAVDPEFSGTSAIDEAFNSDRPYSTLDEAGLEYAFTVAIAPTTRADTQVTPAQNLNKYLRTVRSQVFPTINNLPMEGESRAHAQVKRVARIRASALPNGEGNNDGEVESYSYHLPPSFFLPKPDRCVFPVVFEADYAFIQQIPIGASLHPLIRSSGPVSNDAVSTKNSFVSFSFPRAPKAGVQHPSNKHVLKYSAMLNSTYLHNISHSGWIREHCGQIEKDLLHDPAALIFSMLRSPAIRPDHMENTEKLCLITSSLLLFVREHWLDPHNGVENVLIRLRQISSASHKRAKIKIEREVEEQRAQMEELKKGLADNKKGPSNVVTPSMLLSSAGSFSQTLQQRATIASLQNPFIVEEALLANEAPVGATNDKKLSKDSSKDNKNDLYTNKALSRHIASTIPVTGEEMVVTQGGDQPTHGEHADGILSLGTVVHCIREFGTNAPSVSAITSFQKDHQTGDFFVTFFRILSLWLSHYCSAQRYLETIYLCSHVPFAEWKVVALDIFRRLPYYFRDVQEHLLDQ